MSLQQSIMFEGPPPEVHLMILHKLDHPRTLAHVTLAYPDTLTAIFNRYFQDIFRSILQNFSIREEPYQ